MASIEDKLALAMAELETVQANAGRIQEELDSASVTVLSKDRSVEVTVGSQCQLVSLKFQGDRHRALDGEQLSAIIMETVTTARTRMAERVTDALRPLTEHKGAFADFGPPPEYAANGAALPAPTNWDALFDRLANPSAPVLVDTGTGASGKLRDEIVDEETEPEPVPAPETPAAATPTDTASRKLLDEIVEDDQEQTPEASADRAQSRERG
ncbi:YbaB/EbfC family nucleoid-associated protein [Streptomyces sp. NPDC058469]|uniref:YbaB/EbfC family nucleoid-associated protein n=1 Tax=Streptomyces sp. NPDC058469 TaxID=3346514 RepID=UPI00365C7AF3